jgi:hypothetical protein
MHKAGTVSKATMRHFDETCLASAEQLGPKEIKALRESYHMSQPVFARYLNTSESTGVAQQAAPTQDIRAMIGSRAEATATAESTYNTRYAASDMLATAMRRNSLASLAVGELTNIAVDRTLFNETPHSMRTIVTDCIAPAVVLTRLPLAAKVGIIAGMHLINRYVDSKTDGVGTF